MIFMGNILWVPIDLELGYIYLGLNARIGRNPDFRMRRVLFFN